MRRFFALLVALTLAMVIWAQRQTGSLKGTVTAQDGTPLPAASVLLSGEPLINPITFSTGRDGVFFFANLPPGHYQLKVSLKGFETVVVKDILVRVGKTSFIKVVLKPSTLHQEVTVKAKMPAISVEEAKSSVNIGKEVVEDAPIQRDLYDIINTSPGIVTDNVRYSRTFSTHGSSIRENIYAFDGFMMNDPRHSYLSTNLNYNVIQEVEIETAGHPAEVGEGNGAYVNIVTKSGSNRFGGELNFYLIPPGFSSDSPGRGAMEDGAFEPYKTLWNFDGGFNIGGPISKNKLWYFLSARKLDWSYHAPGFKPEVQHHETEFFSKLSFQPSPAHRFDWALSYLISYEPYWEVHTGVVTQGDPAYIGWVYDKDAAPVWDHEKDFMTYLKWNWNISPTAYLDLRAGYIYKYFPLLMQEGTGYRHYDIGWAKFWRGYWMNEVYHRGRFQAMASLTKFIDNFLGGNHELKMGLEFELAKDDWDTWMPESWNGLYPGVYWTENGNYGLPSWFGVNWIGYFVARSVGTKSGDSVQKDRMRRISGYIQDTFNLGKRLYFNLGVRFDYSKAYIPPQSTTGNPQWYALYQAGIIPAPHDQFFAPRSISEIKDYMNWKTISPRVGVIFDLFGNGRAALKAFYGRYYSYMNLQYTSNINPMYYPYAAYYWYDLNFNGKYDFDGSDFYYMVYSWGGYLNPLDRIDPNLKAPHTDEYVVSLEGEPIEGLRVCLSYIHRYEKDIIEDIDIARTDEWWVPIEVHDPGYDAKLGTSDDKTYTVYFLKAGAPAGKFWITNPPQAYRKYDGVELVITKPFSHGWSLLASLTLSKARATIGNSFYETNGVSVAFDSPNWMVNREGSVPTLDRPVVLKVVGAYMLPAEIMFSFNFMYMSGVPLQRTVVVYNPGIPGIDPYFYTEVLSEPVGTRRGPAYKNLNIRLGRDFQVAGGTLTLSVDGLNILGNSYLLRKYGQHLTIPPDASYIGVNPRWQKPVVGIGQRVFAIVASYKF